MVENTLEGIVQGCNMQSRLTINAPGSLNHIRAASEENFGLLQVIFSCCVVQTIDKSAPCKENLILAKTTTTTAIEKIEIGKLTIQYFQN